MNWDEIFNRVLSIAIVVLLASSLAFVVFAFLQMFML